MIEAPGMLTVQLKHVHEDVDRHGNVRVYFWLGKGYRKIRMRDAVGSVPFMERYEELLQAGRAGQLATVPGASGAVAAGTYRWLCIEWFKPGTSFKALDGVTQVVYRRVLEGTFSEPVRADARETFADYPINRMSPKSLEVLRDRKSGLPGAASNRVKALRALFKWAHKQQHVETNISRDLVKPRQRGSGHHTWDPEEVVQYERFHPVGSKARLALALLLYTGVRRSDVVRLGRQHLRMVWDEEIGANVAWLKFTQHKNRNRRPVKVEIPVLPELQRIIDASSCGDLTYIVTEYGRPFSAAGFGNKFREWCNEADLLHCSAHGLRKAGATLAAENGATAHQLMAVFGWLTLTEAQRYTQAAERKTLARAAAPLLMRKGEQ
jgi:integrase